MIETEKKKGTSLLIGVELQGMDNFDLSMEELASLAKTAGAVVVDTGKKREKYDSKTFVGSGKLEELRGWWMQKKLLLSSSTIV